MTQSAPTALVQGQALILLRELNDSFAQGALRDVNEITTKIRDILTQFEQGAGTPMLSWERIAETEPPSSDKMNRCWRAAANDISLMQHQVDLVRAASVFTYNVVTNEILKGKLENARLSNKLKTLQLYSDNVDSTIVTFGDNFGSTDFFDTDVVSSDKQAQILNGQFLVLGQDSSLINLTQTAKVKVLDSSNGFAGNNLQVDPTTIVKASETEETFSFASDRYHAGDPKAVLDDNPNSWFEYESCQFKDADKKNAKNFNFKYQDDTQHVEVKTIDFSNGPSNDTLILDLEVDLGSIRKVNRISYLPYGMEENKNFPVKISLVEISSDGTTWIPLNPTDVWIGTDPNLRAARTAPNITTSAVWVFELQYARYVRLHVEQPNALDASLGHLWYTRNQISNNTTSSVNDRVEGPLPPLSNPTALYDPSKLGSQNLVQHRERFNGKRWAIGVRDFLVQQVNYVEESSMVTKALHVGSLVDRVSLEADIYVPPTWDSSVSWIKFFVSADNGLNWYPISRIQDDYLGIPEILAFNDPTPPEFRETGVAYHEVSNAVDTLRLRIDMSRPTDDPSSTPVLRNYKLKVRKRI